MSKAELEKLREFHNRMMEKARTSQLDYGEGIQCLLDCGELLKEVDRLRAETAAAAEK